MDKLTYLKIKSGGQLAYAASEGKGPGIVFLGGFRSDMTGNKALALEEFCRKRGQAFLRFDYRGHGMSSGKFENCTIGTWKEDALTILSKLTKGPQILVGSSMGGWLALLAAMEKPGQVAGIIGIAAAPDFPERMVRERFTQEQQEALKREGKVMLPSDMGGFYPITRTFIEESRKHMIMDGEIPVYCPVRLLQGMKDEAVPWEVSLAINEKLASQDVKTILIEDGDHRLSEPKDIERLLRVTGKMLEAVSG